MSSLSSLSSVQNLLRGHIEKMHIQCSHCKTKYRIRNWKTKVKKKTVRCPECGNQIPVSANMPVETQYTVPKTIQCPKCGQKQQKSQECVKCRIIFEKYKTHQDAGQVCNAPDSGLAPDTRESFDKFGTLSFLAVIIWPIVGPMLFETTMSCFFKPLGFYYALLLCAFILIIYALLTFVFGVYGLRSGQKRQEMDGKCGIILMITELFITLLFLLAYFYLSAIIHSAA